MLNENGLTLFLILQVDFWCITINQHIMKQHLFSLLAFLLLTATSKAQINKGSVLLGGNFRLYTVTQNNNSSSKQNGFLVSPVIGKAISQNLVMGIETGIGMYKAENTQTGFGQRNNVYLLGLFLRKYKPVGNDGFYVFLQGNLSGSHNRDKVTSNTSNSKTSVTIVGLGIYPGLSFAICKNFQFELAFKNLGTLSYYHTSYTENNIDMFKTNSFEITSFDNRESTFSMGFKFII
jgi:hypothetical protein